ncbi:hypothetical protein GOODEAATRI_020686, partial [Goodea atripinnis]
MKACSSILALGMMSLCLFIYTSVWTSIDSIKIPFDSIGKLTDLLERRSQSFSGMLTSMCFGPLGNVGRGLDPYPPVSLEPIS